MTFDYELTLIDKTYRENDMADTVAVESRIDVLCDVQSVTRSEHYAAASQGVRPEIVFVLNRYEYTGQQDVEFEGIKYRVIRDYRLKKSKSIDDFETIELICQGAVNHGDA